MILSPDKKEKKGGLFDDLDLVGGGAKKKNRRDSNGSMNVNMDNLDNSPNKKQSAKRAKK